VDATPTAAEGGRDRLNLARMETRNSSFQPATNSAAMGGEGGTLKKIRTRSSSGDSLVEEEAATTIATTQTLAEERRDKRGKRMSTQSCLVCLETTTCQIVRIKEALTRTKEALTKEALTRTKEALTKEDLTRTKEASTKEDLTRTKGASTKDQTRSGVNVNAPTGMERLTKALKRQSVKGVKMEMGNSGVILPATATAVMRNHLDNIPTTPGPTKLVLKIIMESNFKTLVHMKQLVEI